MASSELNPVLRRKASVAKETYQARAMSPEKALRLALAKSADEMFDMSLVVLSCRYDFMTAEEMTAELSDDALLVLLDGAGRVSGTMMLDLMATSALVEQSTMGRVSPLEPEPRATTATDAALIGPLIDDVFLRIAMMLEGERNVGWMSGYTFGVRIENVRLLSLALEAPDFHVFRVHVEFGSSRQGQMLLALPDRTALLPEAEADGDGTPGATVGEAVMSAPATIEAVLRRITLPFSRVSALKVGDVLTIPREALGQTRLETRGEGGRRICLGKVRLGQMNGFRAVRLTMEELAEARDGVVRQAAAVAARPELSLSGAGFAAEDEEEMAMPAMDFGAMEDLPDLSDLPEIDSLPDLEGEAEFPAMGDLPDLSDLPELEGGDFPAMSMADLPDLEE